MKMNIMEKKALYTFGCPNHKATIARLRLLAAITPDPAAGKLFCNLAAKLSGHGEMYRCFFYTLQNGNGKLLRCRTDYEAGRSQHL